MADFQSSIDYIEFQDAVTRKTRYILDDNRRRFLDAVLKTSLNREHIVPAGTSLWRAQLGSDMEYTEEGNVRYPKLIPFSPERMKPFRDQASEGRVNPKGIPALYLSEDRDTALSEMRPWVGRYLSVASFVTVRELRLVDCSRHDPNVTFGESMTREEIERCVWKSIDLAFSEPITRSDLVAEYSPTQFLSEAFRSYDFDGIRYRSSLGAGLMSQFSTSMPLNATMSS